MPVVDSSFVMELLSGETLPLMDPASTSPNSNVFSAIVTTILIERAPPKEENEANEEKQKKNEKLQKKKNHTKNEKTKKGSSAAVSSSQTIRVSLVATVFADKGNSHDITLASAIFPPETTTTTTIAAASEEKREEEGAASPSFLLSLKSPLVFSSTGPVSNLALRTEVYGPAGDIAEQAGDCADGAFVVRLLGVQRTELTQEQVLLMTR